MTVHRIMLVIICAYLYIKVVMNGSLCIRGLKYPRHFERDIVSSFNFILSTDTFMRRQSGRRWSSEGTLTSSLGTDTEYCRHTNEIDNCHPHLCSK